MQYYEQGALHLKKKKEGWKANDMSLLIEHAAQKAQILMQAKAIICPNVKGRCQVYTFIIISNCKDTEEMVPLAELTF